MKLRQGKDFEIVEGKNTKEMAVELLRRPFKGMVVSYGKVGVHDMGTHANLAFDFAIIKGKMPTSKRLVEKFENTLGDILVTVLEKHLETGSDHVEFGNGDDREDNPEKPDQE